MSIYSRWEKENKKIMGEKLVPTFNSFDNEVFISIYLIDNTDKDNYLIVNENDKEYARFSIDIFTREQVKDIFQAIDGKCLHWYLQDKDIPKYCIKYCTNCDKLDDCAITFDNNHMRECLEKKVNKEMV